MSIRLLLSTTNMPSLRQQLIYTLARLSADPRGEPFRENYQTLRERLRSLFVQESDLQDEITTAQANVEYADFEADAVVDEVDRAVDTDEALRKLLFSGKAPSIFKRPIAGVQLAAMETWEQTLLNSKLANGVELAAKCAAVVSKANSAVKRRNEAIRALKEFHATGGRKSFIDDFNTLRVNTYHHFEQFVVSNPQLKISRQYARDFFLQSQEDGTLSLGEELTLLQAEAEDLRQELALKEERIKELVLLKEAEDREEAQELEKQNKIAALEKELATLRGSTRRRR